MGERERRVGRNEELFRRVNDQIEGLNESFGAIAERMSLVCECGDASCIEQIEVSPDEYRRLRSEPELFAIKPGHDVANVEEVVERGDRYWVVRKREGEPAEAARRLKE